MILFIYPSVLSVPDQLSLYALLDAEVPHQETLRLFPADRYSLTQYPSEKELLKSIDPPAQQPDCLILQEKESLVSLLYHLLQQRILLPAVIIVSDIPADPSGSLTCCYYHPAEVLLPFDQLSQLERIEHSVEAAIAQFLQLSPLTKLTESSAALAQIEHLDNYQLLINQQRRLSEKLKERLGYLGVYYKRDPKQFLRHLRSHEAEEFLDTLRSIYRGVVLTYFSDSDHLNQLIDEFVNLAFFADVPVTNIVEMHMELMDEFSKQLKLEGRSEDVLLDYRLTLIDTIAHLCEMYRRSIPREA
jgi:circadian clock protein KaiA